MVVISAGIRPRDELARACGLEIGPRGGVVVDDTLADHRPGHLRRSARSPAHRGMIYGLVAPGYEMAEVVAANLDRRRRATFTGFDMSTKLKLMGVDVASFGDPFAEADGARALTYRRSVRRASTRSSSSTPTAPGCSAASWSATPRTTARCVGLFKSEQAAADAARRAARRPASGAARGRRRATPRSARATTSASARSATRSATRSSRPSPQVKACTQGRHRLRRLPAAGHRPAQGRAQGGGHDGRQPPLRALPVQPAGALPDRRRSRRSGRSTT